MTPDETTAGLKLTNVERRIFDLLGDGLPHTKAEVHACLDDELSLMASIIPHISSLRAKLKRIGQDIVCVLVNTRAVRYRRVRLLRPDHV